MSKTPDLRALKDKAAKAAEKRSYGKAAELYCEIAQHEDDPDWRQRAGEAFRKANKPAEAAEQLCEAAEGYARGGFLLKAIAVCKVVLQLDPRHTQTQKRLAELYALRDGSRTERTPSGLQLAQPVDLGRTESGNFMVARPSPQPMAMREPPPMREQMTTREPPAPVPPMTRRPTPPVTVAQAFPMLPTTAPSPLPVGAAPEDLAMDSVSLPAGAPMDALPLASVIGGRKSQTLPAVKPEEHGLQLDGVAYEIELSSSSASYEALPRLDPLPVSDDSGAHASLALEQPVRPPAPADLRMPPLPSPSSSPSVDELDFSGVMDDSPPPRPAPPPMKVPAAPPPRPAPPPVPIARPAPPPKPPAPPTDELDFSALMEDAPAPAPPAAPSAPISDLPVIPLFSSLTAGELQKLIEGVEVRDFEPGQVIVRQGDPGVALYVIVHGHVEVVVEGPPRTPVAMLSDGAFFGELALLTDFPRSATVQALAPTQLLEISRDLVAGVIAESPEVLKVLLRFFRDRMLDRLLTTSPLFSRFTPADARGLVERFKFLEIDPKTRVIREGERAPGLFLLLCGEVHVTTHGKPIAKLAPGDLFGEMSMLQRGPAMASIDTVSKCWALQLVREDFQEIMLTYPQLLEFVSDLADKRRALAAQGKDGHVQFL